MVTYYTTCTHFPVVLKAVQQKSCQQLPRQLQDIGSKICYSMWKKFKSLKTEEKKQPPRLPYANTTFNVKKYLLLQSSCGWTFVKSEKLLLTQRILKFCLFGFDGTRPVPDRQNSA